MTLTALVAGVVMIAPASSAPTVEPVAKIKVGIQSGLVLSAGGSIWTSDLVIPRLVRIDPAANAITRRMTVGPHPFGLAYGAGSVWVSDRSLNRLSRVSPRTNKVLKKIKIGYASYGLAFGARQRVGDERERRDVAQDQSEAQPRGREDQGRLAAQRRRLRIRRDLGRRPRRRARAAGRPAAQQGDRPHFRAEGRLDHAVGGRALDLERGRRGGQARSGDPDGRRAHPRRHRTRSRPRGSAASSGCRTSTTERSRSSTPPGTRSRERWSSARARWQSRKPRVTRGSRTRPTARSGAYA